jgi:hypothetical protein
MYEELKGQLADCQHGFVKGRSTVLNLLEYSSFILKSIEDGCQMNSIYTDLPRPLIRCVINCSWIKCRLMLTHPAVSGWVFTFLVESSVRMGDCVSRDILVPSGVPQGSHLGLLYFI